MSETVQIMTGCLYCHKEYNPNMTNHYCDDCVAVCEECFILKGLWCFDFDFNSPAYKEWKERGAYGVLAKPGHKTVCGACLRAKDSPQEQLRQTLAKLKPGQLELIMKIAKK
jgi:hypothetical protein